MTRYLTMHPDNPQPRCVKQAVQALRTGEIIAYPTDTNYALGCSLGEQKPLHKIRKLRGLSDKHPLTLVCHSISQASQYALVTDSVFRFLKTCTPGPYTFLLPANNMVPRQVLGKKRRVVGIRIPNHPVPLALLMELGCPMLSTTLWLESEDTPIANPHDLVELVPNEVDLILDAGTYFHGLTTVVDLTEESPQIIRQGIGKLT